MNYNVTEIAERIKELRKILSYSQQDMADKIAISVDEYNAYENAEKDFPVSFLYSCANIFGVDIIELLTGEHPRLKGYEVTRDGMGLPIKRRESFEYYHLAPHFSDKIGEPFLVTAPYISGNEYTELQTSSHPGQEIDYILSGSLRVSIDGREEVVNEGDCIMYDSGKAHGMVAVGGKDCIFFAVIMKK